MTLDHEAVTDMVTELATVVNRHLHPVTRADTERLLLGLDGLATPHLWKEDTAYVPLLAQLESAAYYAALHCGTIATSATTSTPTETRTLP